MTKIDREAVKIRLGKNLERWIKMSDSDMLTEVKIAWPMVKDATRDECIKFLVMNFIGNAL